MSIAYTYYADGFYSGSMEDYGLLPHNSTHLPPPAKPWPKQWPKFVDGAWVLEEDHRERSARQFGEELAQAATEYWLPDDSWKSQPRKMQKQGPLPEGATTIRPEKTAAEKLAEARSAKTAEVEKGYEAAMAASITMPMDKPSAQDVAVGAALFAVDDAEGLEYVKNFHSTTKDGFLKSISEAETAAEVEAIEVVYAV